MDRVVLDTSIVLDYLGAGREEHAMASELIFQLLSDPDLEPVILAGSLKDVYYILNRHYKNEPAVRERLDELRGIVTVEPLDARVLDAAFASDEPDLEDAIVRASAELMGARAIITRDATAFKTSTVPTMGARDFLLTLS